MPHFSSIRRNLRLLTLLLLTSAAVGLTAAFWPKENLLLPRATPAADVSNWWQEDTTGTPYQWFSDHVLFSHSGWWRLQKPFTYDTVTHKKTSLTGLEKRLQDEGDMGTNSWEISPDHEWLLWTMELYDDVKVCRLDGSQHHSFRIAKETGERVRGIAWQADGRHWISDSIDDETGKWRRAIEGNREPPYALHSLEYAEAEQKFSVTWLYTDDNGLHITQPVQLVGNGKASIRALTLRLPEKGHILDTVLDEQNGYVAWLIKSERTPPWEEWLHRLFSRFAIKPQSTLAIWVSHSDGTAKHEVGHLAAGSSADPDTLIQYLAWLPDGKKISFVYKNTLYTVPADTRH